MFFFIKETYENADLDASDDDDEEWTDMVGTRKRKGTAEKTVSVSTSLGASASADSDCSSGAPRRRSRPKANPRVANGTPARLQKKGSGGSSKRRPPYNRLGEAVTQVI